MRLTLGVLAALVALAIPSTASAQEANTPQTPCVNPHGGGNPTDLCGDDIIVRPATPAECPTGGVVIIVINGQRDDDPKRKPGDPADQTFKVCNGAVGPQGPQGPPGQPGPPGPPGPPGDRINVVTVPAGMECPAGGVRVTIIRGEVDTVPPKAGDPADSTFLICNGVPGQQGPPGAPGAPGDRINVVTVPAGMECPAGGVRVTIIRGVVDTDPARPAGDPADSTFLICNGVPGQQGAPGPAGPPGPTGPAGPAGPAGPPACISTRIAKWRIILRNGLRFRLISAQFEGSDAQVTRRRTRGGRRMLVVRIDSRGLPRGIYFARIIYRANGQRGTRHHGFRFCYGNPKGGSGEGPNRFPIDVILGRDRRAFLG